MPNNKIQSLTVEGVTYDIVDNTSGYITAESPALTGTPTAPTPSSGAGDTQIATVKYVQDSMAGAGAGTVTSVGVANATNGGLSVSGSPVTGSGTISVGHSNVLASAQTTSGVYPIKIDKNGHISEYGNAVSIPTKTSDLTNDSGYITSYTETDPVFSASAAAGITSTDISNWNAKVSDTGQWNGVTLSTSTTSSSSSYYIPSLSSTSGTTAYLYTATNNPTNNAIAKYDGSSYLKSTTPSANDNSTKVATTAYVDGAINTLEKIFIVTMTYTNDTYSFDKTYSEIMSAYNAGKHIVGHDTSWQRYWYISTIDSVNAIIKFQLIPDGYTSSSGANIYFDEVSINSSNQITSTNRTITVPIKTSQLTNDSGFTAKSTTTATLTTTWSSKTQTVSVTGVTASNTVVVTPAPASYNAYCEYGVYCSAQASGTLTFICDEVPTSSLTVNVLILN